MYGEPYNLHLSIKMKRNLLEIDESTILNRKEYQEILLARMAGGDLYANELRLKLRRVDIILDKLRDKPLYPNEKKGHKDLDKC